LKFRALTAPVPEVPMPSPNPSPGPLFINKTNYSTI
jgi:hypothetical protein